MTKYNKLRAEAVEACNFRGHEMTRFSRFKDGHGEASCQFCGKKALVDPKPMPNGIDLSGEALALNCIDVTE